MSKVSKYSYSNIFKSLAIAFAVAVLVTVAAVSFSGDPSFSGSPSAAYAADELNKIAEPDFGVNRFQSYSTSISAATTFRVELPAASNYNQLDNGLYRNYDNNHSVAYSIYNPDISVRFVFGAVLSDYADIEIAYKTSANNTPIYNGKPVSSRTENISGQVSVALDVSYHSYASGDYISITITPRNSALAIDTPKVTVSSTVNAASASVINNVIALKVSGTNREEITYSNINIPKTRDEINKSLFVKPGDKIELWLELTYSEVASSAVNFNQSFTAAMGYYGENTCVYWRTFAGNNPNSTTTYLNFDSETQSFYKGDENAVENNNRYFGYSVTFVVQPGAANANGGVLNIVPLFPSGINANGELTFFNEFDLTNTTSGNYISLRVDAVSPQAPVISPDSDFGKTIVNGSWYTAGNSMVLDYSNATFDSTLTQYKSAEEQVYAFVLQKDTARIDLVQYDFTPSNNPSDTAFGLKYFIGTQEYTATRQQLGTFTQSSSKDKSALVFNEPGTWGLALVAVDSAGNVSGYTLYSSVSTVQGRNVVRVDATKRNVYALLDTPEGTYLPSGSTTGYKNYTRYANIYVFAGSQFHDVNGNCIVEAEVPSDVYNADKRSVSTVRVNYVTLRVQMQPDQYNYFEVVGYSVPGGNSSYSLTFKEFVYGEIAYKYLDITITVTDMWWNYSTDFDRYVALYFRQRINIEPNVTDYTYTSRAVTFDTDDVTLYTADTGEIMEGVKPTLGVQYFKQETLVYFSNAAGGSITTGGRIELSDGTLLIEVPEGVSMNTYTSAGTVIETENGRYYVYESVGGGSWTLVSGDTSRATRSFYVLNLDSPSSEGYIDAGDYFYRLFVNASTESDYYGETIGRYYIRKAVPTVNNLHVATPITYLDSMDSVQFASYSATNVLITGDSQYNIEGINYYGAVEIDGVVYYLTAGGVYGTYRIVSPAAGTSDYIKPSGGTISIAVEFLPINLSIFSTKTISEYYKEFFNYFYTESETGGTYILKSAGKHSGNFNSVRFTVSLTVDPKTVYPVADTASAENAGGSYVEDPMGGSGKFVYTYDGLQKQAFISVFLDDGLQNPVSEDFTLYIEYKKAGEDDGSYVLNMPNIAGLYDVRVRVNPFGGNYVSAEYRFSLEILKQQLGVSLDPASGDASYTGEMTIGDQTYNVTGAVEYLFGHLETADFLFTDISGNPVVGLQTLYSVWRSAYFDYDGGIVVADDPEYTEKLPIIASSAFGSGIYLLYAEIYNDNYYGGIYVRMTVRQPTISDGLTVAVPSLKQEFANISLDGTTYGSGTGHLEFGLTLEWATENIMNDDGSARYVTALTAVNVPGRFFFESETEYAARAGADKVGVVNGNTVLDVLYQADNKRITYHSVRIYWQAGSYDKTGQFVPDYNYGTYVQTVPLYVVRAKADFSNIRLSDLVYGQKLSEALFVGWVEAGGYVFQSGEYSLYLRPGTEDIVPSGGEHSDVLCEFVPGLNPASKETDEYFTRRYLTLSGDDAKLSIYVARRNVQVKPTATGDISPEYLNDGDWNDSSELAGAVFRTYGTKYANPAVTVFADPLKPDGIIEAVPVESLTITFTYYIPKPAGYSGDVFEYDGDGDGIKEEYVFVSMEPGTGVGKYYVLISVSTTNYTGETFGMYFVIKAELNYSLGELPSAQTEYLDDIADVDFGTVSLGHWPEGGQGSTFTGTFKLYYVAADGTEYDSYTALPVNEFDEDGLANTLIRFKPASSEDDYYRNFVAYESPYRLTVVTKDISDYITVSADGDGDGTVALIYNSLNRLGVDLHADAVFDDPLTGETFSAEFMYYVNIDGTLSETEVKNAGTYEVVCEIEPNGKFCGSKTLTLVIDPVPVRVVEFMEGIVTDESSIIYNFAYIESAYNGKQFSFIPEFEFASPETAIPGVDLSNLAYEIEYFYFTSVSMSAPPTNIGRYNMSVISTDENYVVSMDDFWSLHAVLEITPNIAYAGNVAQTYAPADTTMRIEDVYPVYASETHPQIPYSVYYDSGAGEFSTELPVNAGEYAVKIVYKENGLLSWTYDCSLVIDPYEVDFAFSDEGYTVEYSATPVSLAALITVPHNVTRIVFEYSDGETVLDGAPSDAGVYGVSVTITDPNYIGSGNTRLTILPASVRMVGTLGSADIEFNTSVEDVNADFAERFKNVTVIFEKTGTAVDGVFMLADGVDISGYRVGAYSIDVIFRPYSSNFSEITATINLNISKKDLGRYIVIDAEVIKEVIEDEFCYFVRREYSASSIMLTASLSEEGQALVMKDYGAVKVNMLYDNSSVAPTEVGSYKLTAEINDSNYEGYFAGVIVTEDGVEKVYELTLEIEKCAPRLDLSNVRFDLGDGSGGSATFPINTEFGVDNIVVNSIFAYRGDSLNTVSGRWVLDDGDDGDGVITFTVANENYVGIWFEPSDQDRYVNVYAVLTVMVYGQPVDDLEQSVILTYPGGADSAMYGVALSEIGITLSEGSDAAKLGTVRWTDESLIVGVGDKAEYVFVPFDENYGKYNVTKGNVTPNIRQAPMYIDAFAYIFTGSGCTAENVNIVFKAYDSEGRLLSGVDYSVELFGSAEGFTAGSYLSGVTAETTFIHKNYVFSPEGGSGVLSLSVFAYTLINEIVHSQGKPYDGLAADMSALNIKAIGAEYELDADDFRLISLKKDGAEIEPDFANVISSGVYTFTVQIFEKGKTDESGLYHTGNYYGIFTFDYVIDKLDLSSDIGVSGNFKTYAENVPLEVFVKGYDDIGSEHFSIEYFSFDYAMSYGSLQPAGAGNYWVRVTLSGSDYYSGHAEFEYVVLKRQATVSFIYSDGSASYTFEYDPDGGYEAQIQVSLSNNLSSKDYTLYYTDPKTGNRFEAGYFPGNIGTYNVVVEINHANYLGTASTTLTIVAAKVTVEAGSEPKLSDIVYGSNLGSSIVTGGVALSNSREVKGTFVFAEPDVKPNAGSYSVAMIFVPDSSNYASVQCLASITVLQSPVSLELISNSLIYNGEHQIPGLNSNLNFNYSLTNSSGATVYQAVNAGVYDIYIEINDPNYVGKLSASFTIQRASLSVEDSVMPVPSSVRYGMSLASGTFSGGSMVYVSGKSAVSGSFSYVSPSIVLGTVGTYSGVEFMFTPNDTQNYNIYIGTLSVEVVKTSAAIYVTGNTNFVYGNEITAPSFSTNPANMTVINDPKFTEFAISTPEVGTYTFGAEISDTNYEGFVTYTVTITKRPLGLSYYIVHEGTTSLTETYTYYYGSVSPVVAKINSEDVVAGDSSQLNALQSKILIYYYPAGADITTAKGSLNVPDAVGDYIAVATMNDVNYYLDQETSEVSYVIRRGTVSSINFDATSLSTQIYGSVTMPTVVTSPAGVKVVVRFEGYDSNVMPTSVGEYKVTAEVVDDNYMPTTQRATFRILPKEISIDNLRAYGKAYDGLADISVTGTLTGVLVGDEVVLHLTAATQDGSAEIGTHRVILTGWSLSGLHAANYTLRDPVYALSATISTNKITDPATESYISSEGGFSSNITVSFANVYDTVNATNIFTKMLGQKATVQVIEIKENGLSTVLKDRVKFYVKIPDEYLNCKNLVVEGLGNLAEVTGFTREGNYITFYANSSGEIVFYTNDFPYWVIIVIAAVVIIILGVIMAFIAAPLRKRKRVSRGARKIYGWKENSGSVEEEYKRKVQARIEERKRKWRY